MLKQDESYFRISTSLSCTEPSYNEVVMKRYRTFANDSKRGNTVTLISLQKVFQVTKYLTGRAVILKKFMKR